MPRTKVKNAITSEKQADSVIRQIGEICLQIEAAETRCQLTINEAKERLKNETEKLSALMQALELSLKYYSIEIKKEGAFDKEKTKKFQFGEISFRQSTSIALLKGYSSENVIDLLKKNNRKDCVRVTETIDKDMVKKLKLSEPVLAALGLQTKEKNEFGYSFYRERLVINTDFPEVESKKKSA